MNEPALLVGHVIFWIFAILTALSPLPWAIPCYLLTVQVDFSGAAISSASTLGIENALKVVALPTLLLLRIGWKECRALDWRPLERAWMLFVLYVVLASVWTPFHLSAIKMIGYLYSYSVLFLVFTYAWFIGWMTQNKLIIVVFVALGLGVLQTYWLGNLFGFGATENRFATFSDAESFAAFLACLLSLVLFCMKGRIAKSVCTASLALGIILTGSRYVFIGLVGLFLVASASYISRSKKKIRIGLVFKRLLIGLIPTVLILGFIVEYLPTNRLTELLLFANGGNVQDVGTFAFRLAIYQQTFQELSTRNLPQLLFGTGTSSGGQVVIDVWPNVYNSENIDGNRSMHDEFFRAVYDWGFIGLGLLLSFLVTLLRLCFNLLRRRKSSGVMAFMGIVPTIFMGLAFANILSEAGFPGGTGFVCVLACASASRFRPAASLRQRKNSGPMPVPSLVPSDMPG